MEKNIPRIYSRLGQPFEIIGLKRLVDCHDDELETFESTTLCRCGQSDNKPYCDGTHAIVGFTGKKEEGRLKDKAISYKGEDIHIHDNRAVCSHDGSCFGELPRVFRKKQEFRWIWPDNAPADRITATIRHCPSGALAYTRDNVKVTDWETEMYIHIRKNGPLEVKGGIILDDDQGSVPQTSDHYTLCRCGGSKNKPFCDGTHLQKHFQADGD